jgi:NodT family efflux transporter outer membrane factor (OMF) lipoprotein
LFGQNGDSRVFNLFTLSTSVNYALDVFGGQRRLVEGLRAQADVALADERAAYIALAANIVNTAIARAAYRDEIEATGQLIAQQKEQVGIARVQADAGTVPYSNVLSLESQLASYQATIPQLEQKLSQSDDLLAALVGHTPAEWHAPTLRLDDLTLPGTLPVSLPSNLVRQRPDILAAEATAHAASAGIGVATAAMLPGITLSGGLETESNSTTNLFSASSRAWSVGGNATAPLFEGGTLWFKRKAAIDQYDQAMALYRQTVLAAFEQVADTLRALDHDAAVLLAQDEALSAAEQALHLIDANYQAGIATYLDVLNADGQYRQAKIAELRRLPSDTRIRWRCSPRWAAGGGTSPPHDGGGTGLLPTNRTRPSSAAEFGYGREQRLGVDRFAQEAAPRNRGLDRAHHRFRIAAQQDGRHLASLLYAQLGEHVQAGQSPVQVVVGDQDVAGADVRQQGLGFRDRRRRAGIESFEAQEQFGRHAHRVVVLDQYQAAA